jgi:hypothetical protein
MDAPRMDPQNLLASKNVLEFVTIANDFCRFIESAEEYQQSNILLYFQRILPLIYLKASLLPDIEPQDENAVEHYVTEEQWETVFNRFRNKFAGDDIFYFIDLYNPADPEPVRASLSENIADIYQDLKDFLLLYQNPLTAFRENAVKDCRFLFETRYGHHIVTALNALHCLLYKSAGQDDQRNLPDVS